MVRLRDLTRHGGWDRVAGQRQRRQPHTRYDGYWAETRRTSASGDGLSGVLLLQAGICAALLLICVGVRASNSGMFPQAQAAYSELISHQSGWEEVSAVLSHLETGWKEAAEAVSALLSGEPVPLDTPADAPAEPEKGEPEGEAPSQVESAEGASDDTNASDLYGASMLLAPRGASGWLSPTLLQTLPGGGNGELEGILVTPSSLIVSTMPRLTAPLDGWISSDFGYRIHPITDKLDYHTGLDIAAAAGSDIRAAAAGTVAETGESDSLGLYVILQHGNAVQTVYGHCSKILTWEGARVDAGDRIALVGSTGVSTGPHLHLEIRIGGSPVDPTDYLVIPES